MASRRQADHHPGRGDRRSPSSRTRPRAASLERRHHLADLNKPLQRDDHDLERSLDRQRVTARLQRRRSPGSSAQKVRARPTSSRTTSRRSKPPRASSPRAPVAASAPGPRWRKSGPKKSRTSPGRKTGRASAPALSPVHRAAGGGGGRRIRRGQRQHDRLRGAAGRESQGRDVARPSRTQWSKAKISTALAGKEEESGKKKPSNCGARVYNVPAQGQVTGTGESVDWSQVFGASPKVGGGLYPLCTLTYDAGWSSYAKAGYGTAATATKEVVKDYLANFVDASEGQAIDTAHWYQALPAPAEAAHNVQAAAEFALTKLG